MAEKKQEDEKYLTFDEATYYSISNIREAIDITIGDDGFRSKEAIEILKSGFHHIHYPIVLERLCKRKHDEEE